MWSTVSQMQNRSQQPNKVRSNMKVVIDNTKGGAEIEDVNTILSVVRAEFPELDIEVVA